MARQRAAKKYLGFPKGLNTETSLLNPEEGTTADEVNMDLRLNKLIRARRLGLKQQSTDAATVGNVIGAAYWQAADVFVVLSVEDNDPATYDTVYIYLHDGDMNFLSRWSVRLLDGDAKFPNFSEVRNRLVMTFGTKPFVFQRQSSGCFDAWVLDLYFRDFKLVEDSLRISERPSTAMTDEHKYNVYNAGWYQDVQVQGGTEGNAADLMFTVIAEYPSNADVLSLAIGADSSGTTIFQPESLETALTGNSEAPRGHYVYNIRSIDRQNKTTNRLLDGVPTSTLTPVLECDVNVSGNAGDLLYVDTAPTGESTDPSGGGGGGGDPTDPTPEPPGYWDTL